MGETQRTCSCCENKTGARIVAILDVIIDIVGIITILFLLEMVEHTKANNPPEAYHQMRSFLIRFIILSAGNLLFGILFFIGIHLKNRILIGLYLIGKSSTVGYLFPNILLVHFLFLIPSLVMIYFIVVAYLYLKEVKKELLTNSQNNPV